MLSGARENNPLHISFIENLPYFRYIVYMFSKNKFIVGIAGTLIVIFIAGFLFVRHLITRSFPDYEGTITSSSLLQPVTIYRDEYGVPHIVASDEDDAYFAVGVVHAQDRLWQMELIRRAGQGRLAEVLGPEALDIDRLFRTLGFTAIVEQTIEEFSPEIKRMMDQYSAGVNHIIRTSKGKYPIEFDVLQFEPEPWEPAHSLLISKLMAYELCFAWRAEVAMGQIIENLEFDLATKVIPGFPFDTPVIVPEELIGRRFTNTLRELRKIDFKYRKLVGSQGTHVGSNSWVISGDLSAHGKTMLANDPHLGLAAPSRWYEVSIQAGNHLHVGGMTLAGSPVVIIGRNNSIAWGLTSMMADDADFYIEEIDTTGTPRYLIDDQWRDLTIREEEIKVRNENSLLLTVFETHRGPLVQSLLGIQPGKWEDQAISIRWTGLEPTSEINTFYGINKASTYAEFRESLRHFSVPGQNFVYADTAGNIAYHAAARVPIRPHGNPTLPFPGWDSRYDWSGYIPFDELPQLYNPPGGIIATANNKIVDDSYPYYISAMWESSSRIKRILEMLDNRNLFLVADFQRMQNDYISVHAREVVPYLLQAFDGIAIDDEDVSRSLSYFRNWDYYFGPEDVPTAIFNVFWLKFIENTFKPRMGEELFYEYVGLSNIPLRALTALLDSPTSEWFENPHTPQRENRDYVIRKSLNDAISFLRENLGEDIRTWHWGSIHTITFEHTFGQRSPMEKIVNIGPYPVGGAGTTVNSGEFFLFDPYKNILGPSMRIIVDLANPAVAHTVIPTGQSGQPLHRHYKDQTQLWLDGRYKTTSMNREPTVPYRILVILPEQ
jgi:penicillin G amidase